jgi:hypothetical protein
MPPFTSEPEGTGRVAFLASWCATRQFYIRLPFLAVKGPLSSNEYFPTNTLRLWAFEHPDSLASQGLGNFNTPLGQNFHFFFKGLHLGLYQKRYENPQRRAVPVDPTAFDRQNATRLVSFTLLRLLK